MAPTVGRGHKGPDVHAVHEEQEEGDVFGAGGFTFPEGTSPSRGSSSSACSPSQGFEGSGPLSFSRFSSFASQGAGGQDQEASLEQQ